MIEQIDSLKQSEKDFRKNEILLKENIDFERMRNEKLEERMGRLLADNVIERARNEKLEERVAKLLNERGILKNKLNEKESINAVRLFCYFLLNLSEGFGERRKKNRNISEDY